MARAPKIMLIVIGSSFSVCADLIFCSILLLAACGKATDGLVKRAEAKCLAWTGDRYPRRVFLPYASSAPPLRM